MIARLQKTLQEREDQGFTLIELLVVVIIIGILAAIAIPIFLNQRQKAWDAAMKNDLHSAALAEESYFTDNQNYLGAPGISTTTPDLTPTSADGVVLAADGMKFSPTGDYSGGVRGVFIVAAWNGAGGAVTTNAAFTGGYCLAAHSASGNWFAYNSTNGGLDNTPLSAAPGTGAGAPCSYNGA